MVRVDDVGPVGPQESPSLNREKQPTAGRTMLRISLVLFLGLSGLMISGCLSLTPTSTATRELSRTDNVSALLARAEEQRQAANTRAKIATLIETYESVLRVDPEHVQSLSNLAQYHILLGTGYSDKRSQKKQHYKEAIAYSERIMYLNSDFRARIIAGQTLWEASKVLTKNEADGMGWWSTAVFYYFKECIPDAFKIFNVQWIKRNKVFLDRIEAVDPDWKNGANYFNLGIYYLALPKSVGGDLKRSAEYLQKAESVGPDRLLIPWGRAKYYYYNQKNRQGFEKDLEWVLAQDPHRSTGDTYPWAVYFQTQARSLLASIDELF